MKSEIKKNQTIGCSLSQGGKIRCAISGGSTVAGVVQNSCIPQSSVIERGPRGPKGDTGDTGATGNSGVYIGTIQPTDPSIKVWIDPSGTQGKISQLTDDTATYPIDKADTLTGLTASITELNYTDGVTSNIQIQLNGKEDTISDLSTIRSGAEAGATAVQPSDLATVATTGDYDDLTNKPTIPTDLGDLTNNAGYIKGITSSDVTNALGYTPYNSTNPDGYITSSALSGYLTTSDIVSSVDSTSTNSKAVGAKLFYDTCGDIETALQTIRGV